MPLSSVDYSYLKGEEIQYLTAVEWRWTLVPSSCRALHMSTRPEKTSIHTYAGTMNESPTLSTTKFSQILRPW